MALLIVAIIAVCVKLITIALLLLLLLLLLLSIFVEDMGYTKGYACKRAPQGTKTHTHTSNYYNIYTYIMT